MPIDYRDEVQLDSVAANMAAMDSMASGELGDGVTRRTG
jgi:hypothetical protein